jgi:hypothetical protein
VRVRPRYYIVCDDGTFARLAVASFSRIVRQDPHEVHPKFHGQRVKYAEIFVALDGRRPVAVRHAAFGYLSFDGEGRFDAGEWKKFADLMVQAWPFPVPSDRDNVSEMRVRVAERRLDEDHNWTPTATLRDQLYAAALHTGRPEETSTRESRRPPSRENVAPMPLSSSLHHPAGLTTATSGTNEGV